MVDPLPFSPFPELVTERLRLRRLDETDILPLFKIRSDDRVNRYLDRPVPQHPDEIPAFIQMINTGIDQGIRLYWVICGHADPQLLGTIGLWDFSLDPKTAEIGFELAPDRQRQGIMHEAVQAVLYFCFEALGLTAVNAFTHPDNAASRRLLENLGFVSDPAAGLTEDGLLPYGLTRPPAG